MAFALIRPAASGAARCDARASGLVVALVAVGLFAVAAFSPALFNDGDTWSHVATGQWILEHGAVPRADPFSHSMAGAPWTAHEWLAEVLFALAYRADGWSGVALAAAFAAAAAALVLGLRLARDLEGAALAVALALSVGLWAPTLLARPHVLALPLAALGTAGLLAARDDDAPPPLLLAGLMTLWSNLHGGFVFGLALIAPFGLEAVLAAAPRQRPAVARGWAAFAGAAVLAALVNPYGVEALVFPFRLIRIENLHRISEWAPQDFGRPSPMAAALLALVGFALTRPTAAPPIRAGLVALLIAMALAQARHGLLLGLIAPMLLARPIAAAIGAAWPAEPRTIARTALTAALAGGLALGAVRAATPMTRADGPTAPIAALAAAPAALRAEPVLNAYGFGGYLIFSHVRPFIDGRADMYRDPMLGLYRRLAEGDGAAIAATLARYRIAWAIFPPDARIVAALDRDPDWRRLYADAVAVVLVRKEAPPAISAAAVSR